MTNRVQKPLLAALDAANSEGGGFWITVDWKDGSREVGAVRGTWEDDRVMMAAYDEDLEETGTEIFVNGRDVAAVTVHGDVSIDGHRWTRA